MLQLNDVIDLEVSTFRGMAFDSREETCKWLEGAMSRIAEKTVEAVGYRD